MKKGFTLIELLAVIVILAIIALIATPIILGIINNAKKESDKRSVELYVKAAELAVARENLKGEFKPTTCEVTGGVCMCEGYADPLNVEMDNASNISGNITFNEKGVVISNTLEVGTATSSGSKVYANGEIVYIDVTTGKGCTNYHEDNSKTGYNGMNPTGNQTSCLKFYSFNDTEESDKVNLLLDHNTTAKVAWNSSGDNASGPVELLTQLTTDTSGWNTPIPTSYTLDQRYQESNAYYTVNYTKARLITAQEIAEITGKAGWDESKGSDWYYFDTLDYTEPTNYNYGWLYDRTSTGCEDFGCLHNSDQYTSGYWTVSAYANNSSIAWSVVFYGYMDELGEVSDGYSYGVRPVIEISKSSLK